MVIGLTGGSGSGKTTALEVLRALGAVCFDADAVYHGLLRTDRALLAAIEAAFPGTVTEGTLDRKALGRRVFGDAAALRRLTDLTQPRVAEAIRAQLRPGALAVIDAIGLLESGLARLCDCTVAVTAPAAWPGAAKSPKISWAPGKSSWPTASNTGRSWRRRWSAPFWERS